MRVVHPQLLYLTATAPSVAADRGNDTLRLIFDRASKALAIEDSRRLGVELIQPLREKRIELSKVFTAEVYGWRIHRLALTNSVLSVVREHGG